MLDARTLTRTPHGACTVSMLTLIGGVVALAALARLLRGVWKYFLRPGKDLRKLGSWAVVTGATDGIGRAYADVLAKKGLNVLLISRTESKLKAAAAEISSKYGVATDTLAIDFGASLPSAWVPLVAAAVGPLDVGVLVNNVGLSYDHAEYYDALDDEAVNALVAINIQATNHMTKAVLPGMKSRRRGAIVCIGSAAATVAPSGPLYAVYAGTKAYVDMFARSLDLECKAWGVSVQNQAPAYVATKMSKIRKPTLDAPSPAVWAAAAAKHIGYEPTSVPYWYHGAMWGAVDALPGFIVNAYLLSFHEWLRARYYKKVEREARGGAGGAAGAAAGKGKKAR